MIVACADARSRSCWRRSGGRSCSGRGAPTSSRRCASRSSGTRSSRRRSRRTRASPAKTLVDRGPARDARARGRGANALLDERAAAHFAAPGALASTRSLHPLPVLGIPGWTRGERGRSVLRRHARVPRRLRARTGVESQAKMARRSLEARAFRGKSGLRRAGCWITSRRREATARGISTHGATACRTLARSAGGIRQGSKGAVRAHARGGDNVGTLTPPGATPNRQVQRGLVSRDRAARPSLRVGGSSRGATRGLDE